MNTRRKLVVALGASALIAPFGSFAQQQGKVWRVGILSQRARPASLDSGVWGAFRSGMRELGYVEGKNLEIEWRFADTKYERLPDLAAEQVKLKVDLIVTAGPEASRAAQKSTTTIPIVFTSTQDPVHEGLVKSLAHPGGNITGLSNLAGELGAKQLEMLHSIAPKVARVAVMVNPENSANTAALKNIRAVAKDIGVTILSVEAKTLQEIGNAFAVVAQKKAGALVVARDALFAQQVHQIAEFAVKNRLPSITVDQEYAMAGGLMSYGPSFTEMYRRAATYVDKIFKGAKPADLPVEQPTKFELFINGKTAKTLGLKIPQSLLVMADKVIE